MQDLIRIDYSPATIDANFDEVEAQLRDWLTRYDVIVSPDAVTDARKLRTDLREKIKELDQRIKDVLAEAGAPIKQADERRKQLVQLGRDVDAKIKEQIQRYDDEKRAKAEQLLSEHTAALWDDHGVRQEFQKTTYGDLVKPSALTKQEKLTKNAKTALHSRVREDKALQDRTDRRLAELAGKSYEAGLAAPLTRDHVEHFLFLTDDAYEHELQRIVDAEVDRQQKAEQRLREKQERERQQQAETERREAERQQRMEDAARAEQQAPEATTPAPATTESYPGQHGDSAALHSESPAATPAADGKETWHVVMTFEIRVPAGTTLDQIKAEARWALPERMLNTLANITAQQSQRAA